MAELAQEQVRRACQEVMDLRAEYADAVKAVEAQPNVMSVRQAAHSVWRRMQAAEKTVRELPIETLLAASMGRTSMGRTPPKAGEQLGVDDVLDILRAVEAGEEPVDIAKRLGYRPDVIREHVAKWNAGTSRVAKHAKSMGLWPHGRAAA